MVVGASVFGYVIANVSALVTNMSSFQTKALERTYLIKEFLKQSKVHSTLCQHVLNHFQQASRMSSSLDKIELLERLPTRLRNEILLIGYRDAISAIPFFKFISNVSIKLHILQLMTPQVAVTGRRIINEGKAGNQMVFLIEGSASILKILDPDSRCVKRLSLSKQSLSSARTRSTAQMTVALQILKVLKEKEMKVKEREMEKEIKEKKKEKEIEKKMKSKEMEEDVITAGKISGAIEDYRKNEVKVGKEGREDVGRVHRKGQGREESLGFHTEHPLPLSLPLSLPHSPSISLQLPRSLSLDTALDLPSIAGGRGVRHGSPRMPRPTLSKSTKGATPQRGSFRMSIIEERESGDEGEGGNGGEGGEVDEWDGGGGKVGEAREGKGSVLGANAFPAHMAQTMNTLAATSNISPAPQLSASSTSSYFTAPSPLSFTPPTRTPTDTPPPSRREDGAHRSVPVSGIKVTVLGRLDAGDFIGHREIMRGEQHAYTVIASEPCKYYTLNKQDILSLVAQSPDIALELQAALGHAVFDEEQHTAEKRSRRRKLQFISDVKEKFLASRMQFKRKDSTLNRVVMRIMRSSRKQSSAVAPMSSRSGSRRDSTASEIYSKSGKTNRIVPVDWPDKSGNLIVRGEGDVGETIGGVVGGTVEWTEDGHVGRRAKGPSGRVDMPPVGVCPSLRAEGSLSLSFPGVGAGTIYNQKNIQQIGLGHRASGARGPLCNLHSSFVSSALGGAVSLTATAEGDDAKNNRKAIDEKMDKKREVSRRGSAVRIVSEVNEKVDLILGGKRGKSFDRRGELTAAIKKIERLEKMIGTDSVLPAGSVRESSLILFKRQQTAFFLGMGAVAPSPALRGAVGAGVAVRKARKNSTETPESHGLHGPKSIIRNHRSYNDLSFAPHHTIARELFLGPRPSDSTIFPSQQRYQRRDSYPSDQSQFDLYDSRCALDDLVLHRSIRLEEFRS
jgi:CRP-like cAMP-binding protein